MVVFNKFCDVQLWECDCVEQSVCSGNACIFGMGKLVLKINLTI